MEGRQSVILRFSTVQTVGASNATLSRVNYNLLHQGQPDCASAFPGEFATVPVSRLYPRDVDVVGMGWGLGTHFLDARLVGLVDVWVQNHHLLPPSVFITWQGEPYDLHLTVK